MNRRLRLKNYRSMAILGWVLTAIGWLYVGLVTVLITSLAITQPTGFSGTTQIGVVLDMVVFAPLAYALAWLLLSLPGLFVAMIGEVLRVLRDIARDVARFADGTHL